MGYVLHKLAAISPQGWIDDMQHALEASAYDDVGGGATERSCLVRSTKKTAREIQEVQQEMTQFQFQSWLWICGWGHF